MSEPVDIVRAVDLRPELLPPPVSRQRLDELSCEIDRIAALVADRSEDADDAIRAFNAHDRPRLRSLDPSSTTEEQR